MPTNESSGIELFDELRRTGRRQVRNSIVERHMGLAVHIAQRYSPSGRRDDDLEQAAMLALVKAVDRFDPTIGVPFSAYAGRTIEGEIKRYLRDATWAISVPRRAKELHLAVIRANEELSVRSGRSPTVGEVATHLDIDRDDVITGLTVGEARRVAVIDPDPTHDGATPSARGSSPVGELGFGDVENEADAERVLVGLPEKEQEIVRLRFYDDLSQSEIAQRVGMSQMHVSRLLRKALDRLHDRHAGEGERDRIPEADEL